MEGKKWPLAVRMPSEVVKPLQLANETLRSPETLRGPSFNLLANDLVIEALVLLRTSPFVINDARMLFRLRGDRITRKIFEDISRRDITRRVSNAATQSVKLPLSFTQRQLILSVANQLNWTAAQTILETLQAAAVIIGADEPLHQLPQLFLLYRGSMVYEGRFAMETPSHLLKEIGKFQGFLKAGDLTTQEDPEPLTTYLDLV